MSSARMSSIRDVLGVAQKAAHISALKVGRAWVSVMVPPLVATPFGCVKPGCVEERGPFNYPRRNLNDDMRHCHRADLGSAPWHSLWR